jgi:hypothetical protein
VPSAATAYYNPTQLFIGSIPDAPFLARPWREKWGFRGFEFPGSGQWAILNFVASEGIDYPQETQMETARLVAIFVAIFAGLLVAFFCVVILAFDPSGEREKAARDKRMAEHKMAARLLRLDI